jgi:hypothetical protein
MNGVLADTQVKDAFEKLGIEPMGGAAGVLAGRVQTETRKWIDIAREKRIQVE